MQAASWGASAAGAWLEQAARDRRRARGSRNQRGVFPFHGGFSFLWWNRGPCQAVSEKVTVTAWTRSGPVRFSGVK